jgi:hypothetical protein
VGFKTPHLQIDHAVIAALPPKGGRWLTHARPL